MTNHYLSAFQEDRVVRCKKGVSQSREKCGSHSYIFGYVVFGQSLMWRISGGNFANFQTVKILTTIKSESDVIKLVYSVPPICQTMSAAIFAPKQQQKFRKKEFQKK